MKNIKVISFITLIGLFWLFFPFPTVKAHASEPDTQERPLIEDPTGEDDDTINKSSEPDFDEKDLETLDPWYFEDDGKDASRKEINQNDRQKNPDPKNKNDNRTKDQP